MWRGVTWEQFARTTKFTVGLGLAIMEVWQWGGRPYPLAFVACLLGLTEAGPLLRRLVILERSDGGNGSSDTGTGSPPSP